MNTTWVLVALIYNGHLNYSAVPTLKFSTQQKCQAAIVAFESDSASTGKRVTTTMRCVGIEK